MEEDTDEVVPFVKELLQKLKSADAPGAFSAVWRYFLTQTQGLRRVLQKRLTRDAWPEIYKGIDGERRLHITVGGACPAGCLMGFMVWLAETRHFDCQVTCSSDDLTPFDAIHTVAHSLRESGWDLDVLSVEDHQRDLESGSQGLDIVLVGHPEERCLSWHEFVHQLRPSGCLLLLDFPECTNFSQVQALREIEYAFPAVYDLLPPGLEVFSEPERSAVRSLSLIQCHLESEFPVLENESVATLFVRRVRIRSTTAGSSAMSPDDSWEKSEPMKTSRPAKQHEGPRNEIPWRGSWMRLNETGAVPPVFAFTSLDLCPLDDTGSDAASRAYYELLREHDRVSRIEFEGMGRPLILNYKNLAGEEDM